MTDIEEKRIIPLKFDLMFKKVFGDKNDLMPLRELLKCILEINPKEITILNPEIIGSSYYNKGTIVDLIVEIEDGIKIGIEKGKENTARNMLKEKIDINIISKVTGLSINEIKNIK